jgi:hypothetical protein
MKTAVLSQFINTVASSLASLNKIPAGFAHKLGANPVKSYIFPLLSQAFKDNLLFSEIELELMTVILLHYKKSVVAAAQVAVLYLRQPFKTKENHNPCYQSNGMFGKLQPCV